MTDERLRELRAIVRKGELPADLVDELRLVVSRLVRLRLLPPLFAPYGSWDAEAAEEIFQEWYAERLLRLGHLQLLLDRARNGGGFRKLAELSLRQHLYNQSARSQARNLFGRVVELLESDLASDEARFICIRDASRPQDRYWRLATNEAASEWAGDDDRLLSEAWALGEFEIIRYRPDAKKLSPVLSSEDVERFVVGLLERSDAALSPTLIMRAMAARFDLGEIREEELSSEAESVPSVESDFSHDVGQREIAAAVVAELTPRQLDVLRRTEADQTIDAMAADLECSVGTVINEQRRVGATITRFTESEDERKELLRIVIDLLYEPVED